MARNYEVDKVIRSLNQKRDIMIPSDAENRTIFILFGNRAQGDVGIKSRGKVDFLVNYHHFRRIWVTQFN